MKESDEEDETDQLQADVDQEAPDYNATLTDVATTTHAQSPPQPPQAS